jgi:tetratricopeptide (TPR) repeat protein
MTQGFETCTLLAAMQPDSDPRFCDGCGQSNRAAARFCASCGADLPDRATEALAPGDLARRLCERGEPLQARALLETALTSQPDDHQLRLVYAALLLQAADWQTGLEQLERVRASAPWSAIVEAYIGGALLGLNRVSDAKDVLDDAVLRAPTDFYVLLKRGELYCRLGIYLTAVDALERASRIGVDDPIGREAVRRLLRFAREKSSGGFVRQLRARTTGFTLKWRWRAATPHRSAGRADEVWGT